MQISVYQGIAQGYTKKKLAWKKNSGGKNDEQEEIRKGVI